jgi:acetyl-CoA synthetase
VILNGLQKYQNLLKKNCIDRHLNKRGDKTAIIFDPNNPNEDALHITYTDLHKRVCQMANVLRANKARKGERLYLSTDDSRELVITMLVLELVRYIQLFLQDSSSTAVATE